MKLAFLTDFHLGLTAEGREEDAFKNAMQAMKQALAEEPDAIVFNGDMFHHAVPDQKILLEAFRLLALPKKFPAHLEIEKIGREGKTETTNAAAIPFIAIHGTHEFRGKDFTNIFHILEKAGALTYLHAEKAVLTKHREKVVLHGLGGVPEKKALDALLLWNPKPEPEAYNIVLLHQSFKEFLPFDDDMVATLSISDLPKGFDLIVNGHLHWQSEFEEGVHMIIPGSTVITQMKRLEAQKPKGFYLLETKTGQLEFKKIEGQRAFKYLKSSVHDANAEQVKEEISKQVKEALSVSPSKPRPLIKIKLVGSLAKGFSPRDLSISEIEESFSEKAIVSISANFQEVSFKKKMRELGRMQEQKKSIAELGLEILERNLEETNFSNAFDARRVFELLKEGETDKALELISESQPTPQKSEQ